MEQWTRWDPIEGITGRLFIEDFHLSNDGLSIRLRSEKNNTTIKILFSCGVEAYRYINESWCFDVFGNLRDQYGAEFIRHWSLFKINNSNYVKSLSLTSSGTSESSKFDHFCILGNDEIIDILATYEPDVTLIS